jgi:hypothetical protein
MKTPQGSKSITIPSDYNSISKMKPSWTSNMLKDERRTPNVQHRILNKAPVKCFLFNWVNILPIFINYKLAKRFHHSMFNVRCFRVESEIALPIPPQTRTCPTQAYGSSVTQGSIKSRIGKSEVFLPMTHSSVALRHCGQFAGMEEHTYLKSTSQTSPSLHAPYAISCLANNATFSSFASVPF